MSDLLNPELHPLWLAIKARIERDGNPDTLRTVRVELSQSAIALLNGWLARSTTRRSRVTQKGGLVQVPIRPILNALNLKPEDLPKVLADTVGAPNPSNAARELAVLRSDLWEYAATVLPRAPQLVRHLRTGGISDLTANKRRLLVDALGRAHSFLPLDRPVSLPRFAYHCSGDPHFFDFRSPGQGGKLGMLVAELLQNTNTIPLTPAHRNELLARAGIHADRLSSTVLTLNLDATGESPVDEALRTALLHGRPSHLTYYDLSVYCPQFSNARPVVVVENPSVIEEALVRGFREPLACTSGALTSVDHKFLGTLCRNKVPIKYAGDGDVSGEKIAAQVAQLYDAEILVSTNPVGGSIVTPRIGPIPALTFQPGPHSALYQESRSALELLLGNDAADPFAL